MGKLRLLFRLLPVVPVLAFFACNNNSVVEDGSPAVDKTELSALIDTAKTAMAGVEISADGTDVPEDGYWVPQNIYDDLQEALELAEKTYNDISATRLEVDYCKKNLQSRLDRFEEAKMGKKQGMKSDRLITMNGPPGIGRNSVNTTPFRQSSMVTHENIQYISYWANNHAPKQSYLVLGRRSLGDTEFQTTVFDGVDGNISVLGWTDDAHNSIGITTDGDGYLHIVWSHHNNALEYYRSNETVTGAEKITLTKYTSMTGNQENQVTYGEFYKLPNDPAKGDGDILFVYRIGSSGSGNIVLNRYSRAAKTWSRVQDNLVSGSGAGGGTQSAYWQMYLDENGRLHLSWVFRESSDVRTNHDMYYACSDDQGVTWKRSNSTQYTLPITAATTGASAAERVWEIPRDSNLMNQTSMTADNNSNPYIATYWGRPTMQYRVIYFDGTSWQMSTVSNRTTIDDGGQALPGASPNPNPNPYLSGGGTKLVPISRPRMVAKYDNATGKTKAYYIFRDNWERDGRVSMYYTDDITGNVWEVRDLTDFTVQYYEPSHDTELWKNQGKLHVFVQYADFLSDGSNMPVGPEGGKPVYCLEVDTDYQE